MAVFMFLAENVLELNLRMLFQTRNAFQTSRR